MALDRASDGHVIDIIWGRIHKGQISVDDPSRS